MNEQPSSAGHNDPAETNALLALIEDDLVDTKRLLLLSQRLSSARFQALCDRLIELAEEDLELVSEFILSLESRDRD